LAASAVVAGLLSAALVAANGPIVANLAWPQDGQAADCLTEGETDPSGLKFPTAEQGIVQRILNDPASFYVNVHNIEFPMGAIRGQLGAGEHKPGQRRR